MSKVQKTFHDAATSVMGETELRVCRLILTSTLDFAHGNEERAADILGISVASLKNMMGGDQQGA
jgi:DNA-binding protein Fis